jgi:hypothetical protein
VEDGAMPPETETPTPAAPQQASAPPPAPAPAGTGTPPDQLGDAGIGALQKERADRKAAEKRASELEARLQAIEDQGKSELERAQSRLAELEKNYATEQQQRLRLQVATAHSIGPDDLVLLTGATEDELTAQATRIAALNATRAAATAAPAFAPSPAQHAGNGTPAPPTATVTAGRDLYRSKHKQPTA